MAFTNLALNPAATAGAGAATMCSLHTAAPDGTGSNELVGTGYARQPVTWGTASNGTVTATTDPEFVVPGGQWVRWVGLWTSGGAWVGGIELATQVEYPADGTYTVSPLRVIAANPTA
ncbi:hypothetical protein ABZ249_25300 [Nocardiopsis sp. NPDC006139]|uniref:phage tail fiber protein n=1 Tax=Nocardiopsis sp. NPDC006139 TaxID=3154578 RepID=UPI0033BF908C